VAEFGYDPADKRAAPSMPLEVDGTMKISCAVDFCPAMGSARLFRPDFDEAEFPLQLRIAHDLDAQRAATARNHLDHRLHSVVRLDGYVDFATFVIVGARALATGAIPRSTPVPRRWFESPAVASHPLRRRRAETNFCLGQVREHGLPLRAFHGAWPCPAQVFRIGDEVCSAGEVREIGTVLPTSGTGVLPGPIPYNARNIT
jgi:hypothetical protein